MVQTKEKELSKENKLEKGLIKAMIVLLGHGSSICGGENFKREKDNLGCSMAIGEF